MYGDQKNKRFGIQELLLLIVNILMVCAIPWGYSINARLVGIETKIENSSNNREKIDQLTERIIRLESKR